MNTPDARLPRRKLLPCLLASLCAPSLAAEVTTDVDQFLAATRQPRTPWEHTRTFETRIRRNIRLAEAPSYGQTIFEYRPDCRGAQDYLALSQEAVARR